MVGSVLSDTAKDLANQIKAVDEKIRSLIESNQQFSAAKKLKEAPGTGKATAAAVASRLCAKRFGHPDQFVPYAGLDIAVEDSGGHQGRGRLSKQGDAELGRLLYLCAQSSLRAKGSPFAGQYEREKARGLKTTAALCAVARKMAKVCQASHHYDRDYHAASVYTRPTRHDNKGSQEARATLERDLSARVPAHHRAAAR